MQVDLVNLFTCESLVFIHVLPTSKHTCDLQFEAIILTHTRDESHLPPPLGLDFQLRTMWAHFYKVEPDVVLFVVDANDRDSIAEGTCWQLHRWLQACARNLLAIGPST
jgi:hypothetical protein